MVATRKIPERSGGTAAATGWHLQSVHAHSLKFLQCKLWNPEDCLHGLAWSWNYNTSKGCPCCSLILCHTLSTMNAVTWTVGFDSISSRKYNGTRIFWFQSQLFQIFPASFGGSNMVIVVAALKIDGNVGALMTGIYCIWWKWCEAWPVAHHGGVHGAVSGSCLETARGSSHWSQGHSFQGSVAHHGSSLKVDSPHLSPSACSFEVVAPKESVAKKKCGLHRVAMGWDKWWDVMTCGTICGLQMVPYGSRSSQTIQSQQLHELRDVNSWGGGHRNMLPPSRSSTHWVPVGWWRRHSFMFEDGWSFMTI